MEQEKNGEQLKEDNASIAIHIANENDCEEKRDDSSSPGSLGKFKDTESLLKAYNNLQAEFTKKCQSLSKLKDELGEKEETQPIYEKENWTEMVSEFMEKNQNAKKFSSEIAKKLIEDDALAKKDNALEIAWAQVASEKYVSPESLIEDKDFLKNYVLENETIKKAVLDSALNDVKKAPTVINSSIKGGNNGLYRPVVAKTLSEAKELVRKLFD